MCPLTYASMSKYIVCDAYIMGGYVMRDYSIASRANRRTVIVVSGILAFLFTLFTVQLLTAAEGVGPVTEERSEQVDLDNDGNVDFDNDSHVEIGGGGMPSDLSGSSKTVAESSVEPGETLSYTIVISNSGGPTTEVVTLRDALPTSLALDMGSLSVSGGGSSGAVNNVITWTGSLTANAAVQIQFSAMVTSTAVPDTIITNTVEITSAGSLITRTAGTTVLPITTTYFLPYFIKPIPQVAADASQPDSNNAWSVFWPEPGTGITGYEIQESQNEDFSDATTYNSSDTVIDFSYDLSPDNVYYYRVRAVGNDLAGPWSETQMVIAGYRDDFDDDTTGWAVRRMSLLEETDAKYGRGDEAGNLIIIVADRWDWLLASPMRPAPELPYVIEYRSRVHDASNLVSGGAVVGGDWNGGPCPELGNVYETTNCFNHFYNFNYIFYGPLKLLFEQVDRLVWCPNCGGSLLKRIAATQEVDPIFANGPSLNWHTYKIEVREDGLRLYVDGNFIRHFTDTSYVNDPYFGVFASTDEYKPSIWFYDYYQVTPLD